MKLLKQRLKRLLVCFLAVALLWQPIMAYAAAAGVSYGTFNADDFIGSVLEFNVGDTIPAGKLLLADAYHIDDEEYQGVDKAAQNKTLIQNILGDSSSKIEICEALFYVQESGGDDRMVVYDYGGFRRSTSYNTDTLYAPMAYKLYDKYTDKDGNERKVTGWKILAIDEIGGEVTDVEWVTENYVTTPQYDHSGYIYEIDSSQRQKYGADCDAKNADSHEFTGYNFYKGVNYKGLFIKYKLIKVEPIYEGDEDPATVTFDPNGEGASCSFTTKEVAQGATYAPFPVATWDYHELQGWFKQDGVTKIEDTTPKPDNEDETLYAHWEEYQYTIKFDANGGSGSMGDMKLKYSEKESLTQNAFTREGYTFLGWGDAGNATSVQYQDKQEVQGLSGVNGGTVTLYAIWQEDEPEIPIVPGVPKVTFDPNGGSKCNPPFTQVSKNDPYGDLPTTTRDKHTFLGWYTTKDGGTEVTKDSIKLTDEDETLYAHWEEYQYTIKFDANGGEGSMDDMKLKYSETKSLTANTFTNAGYQFAGWGMSKGTTTVKYENGASVQKLSGDNNGVVTLYAVWRTPAKEDSNPSGKDGLPSEPEVKTVEKTYFVQKIENVETSDNIHIYRYLLMFAIGVGFICLSVWRFRKKVNNKQ